MKYRCRCSRKKCQARRTLAKHPDDYLRPPKCKYCGNNKWRIDKWRHKKELHRSCRCQGSWYPHRRGSKACLEHPENVITKERNSDDVPF